MSEQAVGRGAGYDLDEIEAGKRSFQEKMLRRLERLCDCFGLRHLLLLQQILILIN